MTDKYKSKSIWKEEPTKSDDTEETVINEKIIDTDSKHINNFVQQNSPVNNELIRNAAMNNLLGVEAGEDTPNLPTPVLVKRKTRKTKAVHSLCSFSFDDTVDFEILNKNGRFKITGYDRRIYNAIGTLWLNGRKVVTLTEIFGIMNGYTRSNPSAKQLQAVERSLNKLRSVKVFIDFTQEAQAQMLENKEALIEAGILNSHTDKIKKAVLEDNMLHFSVGTITSEQGKVFKSIHIVGEPSLLTYNRAKGTLITIPIEYIGLNDSNATEKTIAFQDYLLMRILSYKNKKMLKNKISYDTLYKDSGIARPEARKDFKRDRETVVRLMDEWMEKGLITGYEEVKEGRSYTGIVFYTQDDEQAIGESAVGEQ